MSGNGKEYALAMFSIALENESMEEIHSDLNMVRDAIKENPEYLEFLLNPAVLKSERVASVAEVFEGRVCEDVFAFLNILCDHADMYSLVEAIDEFGKMYEDYMNFSKAVITSAVELTDSEKVKLINKLQKVTKKRIDPEYVIDEKLMGGLTVMVDGKFFDGSVRKNFNNLKEVMS